MTEILILAVIGLVAVTFLIKKTPEKKFIKAWKIDQ